MARLRLWQAKMVAMVGLLLSMFFATLLPLCVRSFFQGDGKGKGLISYLSIFGGGVFLAIYLLILAPEVQILMRLTLMEPYHVHYPVPELMIAGGFFFMVLVAKILHTLESKYSNKSGKRGYLLLLIALSFTNILEGLSIGFQRSNKGVWNLVLAILIMDSVVSFCIGLQMITDTGYEQDHMLQKVRHRSEEGKDAEGEDGGVVSASKGEKGEVTQLSDDDKAALYGSTDDANKQDPNDDEDKERKKRTRKENNEKVREVVISAFVYSAMTSLGIIIGTLVMHHAEEGPGLNLANGILQAIAAGTFLYTTFFEVLFGELEANAPVSKLVTFILGFTMIALLTIEEEEMMENVVEALNITATTLLPPLEDDNITSSTTSFLSTSPADQG